LRDARLRREKLDAALKSLEDAAAAGGVVPKRVPLTDLESRVMPNKDGGHAPNYTPTATVDLESGLIVAADVLNVINEDGEMIAVCEEVREQFALPLAPSMAADGLMATGANIAACEERGITLYSPTPLPDPATNPALRDDPSQAVAQADWERLPTHPAKDGGKACRQLDKTAFVYDESRDCYWCPLGQPLHYSHTTSEARGRGGRRVRRRYHADAQSCSACALRERCVMGNRKSREVNREQFDAHRERHALHMARPESQTKYARRRHAGERPFATIKHQFGLRQFLLRGLHAVADEWRWAVVAFNLHRMINLLHTRAGPTGQQSFSPSPPTPLI
jgi:hypothetical protein